MPISACLEVKAINCISPCLRPVLIGFNLLPTVIFKSGEIIDSWDLLRAGGVAQWCSACLASARQWIWSL
jgi:hypothetical protein